MKPTRRAAVTATIAGVVVVAVGWSVVDHAAVSAVPTVGASTAEDTTDAMIDLPTWQTIEIVDVDGETFTLADYIGTPVLVETFATWCSNCRSQLGDTQEAAAALVDEAAVVALSVETDLSPDDVAEYAADNGFTEIRFAVMSPELLAELADAFGTTVANPPSTPKFIIDAVGQAGELTTGAGSVEDIVADLRAASADTTDITDSTDSTTGDTDA